MQKYYNSHYGSYSKNRFYEDLSHEKNKPTAKQQKFFKSLYAACKEHGLDVSIGHRLTSRVDYASAISTLLARLNEAGVDIHGNGKQFEKAVVLGTDSRGRDYSNERMVFKNETDSEESA